MTENTKTDKTEEEIYQLSYTIRMPGGMDEMKLGYLKLREFPRKTLPLEIYVGIKLPRKTTYIADHKVIFRELKDLIERMGIGLTRITGDTNG